MVVSNRFLVIIVTNGVIIPEYYASDSRFSSENYLFFNVCPGKMQSPSERFRVLDSDDVPGYIRLGREWAESEIIYNYDAILGVIGQQYGEIGIIHWDFNFQVKSTGITEITSIIEKCLDVGYKYISFFPAEFKNITGMYNVMMDERRPNCLFTSQSGLRDPKSANSYVFDYFSSMIPAGASVFESMVHPSFPVSLCCAGVFPAEWFSHARKFMDRMIADDVESRFDTQKRHRFPGQLMERFVAIDSLFRNKALVGLDHRFTGGLKLKVDDPDGENY